MSRIKDQIKGGKSLGEISEAMERTTNNTVYFAVKKKLKLEFPDLELKERVIPKDSTTTELECNSEDINITVVADSLKSIWLYIACIHFFSEDGGIKWETKQA